MIISSSFFVARSRFLKEKKNIRNVYLKKVLAKHYNIIKAILIEV
jgi:hypothetical protein